MVEDKEMKDNNIGKYLQQKILEELELVTITDTLEDRNILPAAATNILQKRSKEMNKRHNILPMCLSDANIQSGNYRTMSQSERATQMNTTCEQATGQRELIQRTNDMTVPQPVNTNMNTTPHKKDKIMKRKVRRRDGSIQNQIRPTEKKWHKNIQHKFDEIKDKRAHER